MAVAAGTGGADGHCPPKTNCKIRITINIKIVICIVYSNI
jgi:hypothetical protein